MSTVWMSSCSNIWLVFLKAPTGSDSPRPAPDLVGRRTSSSLSPAEESDQDPICVRALGCRWCLGSTPLSLFRSTVPRAKEGTGTTPPPPMPGLTHRSKGVYKSGV